MQKLVVIQWILMLNLLNYLPGKAFGNPDLLFNEKSSLTLYESLDFGGYEKPAFEIFNQALAGYQKLKALQKLSDKEIITLIDFSKSANKKRLWIIDLKNSKVLKHTLVAHGRNTGDEYAQYFSNTPQSNQSSLGFYVTGGTYIGKHGISLKLHGAEAGINDNAEKRSIVMHAAEYVSEAFIKRVGRLGRSQGCPAVPVEEHQEIIKTLANKTCLFIYYPDQNYLSASKLLASIDSTI